MNVYNIINQNAYIVILAIGMLLCILGSGSIDLSVGSVVGVVGACAGIFIMKWKIDPYLSILMCMGVGILVGVWQGFWIAYVKIPAFIVTLAGMLVFRGATLIILQGGKAIPVFPAEYKQFFVGTVPEFIGRMGNRRNDDLPDLFTFGHTDRGCILCCAGTIQPK